jgi:hypothetical protein
MQADDVVTQCTLLSDSLGAFRLPTLSELCSYRIIVCTCIAAAFFLRYKDHALSCPLSITHLFIDEAGQAPLLEALLPMLLVKEVSGSVCIAGDPRQLGPVVHSPVAAVAGLEESMLERLIDYYQALPEILPVRSMCTLLVRNYRSHERLLKLPSDLFYGSALHAAADQEGTRAPPWSVLGTARAFLCCDFILCSSCSHSSSVIVRTTSYCHGMHLGSDSFTPSSDIGAHSECFYHWTLEMDSSLAACTRQPLCSTFSNLHIRGRNVQRH